jgi:hypothetical protein
MTTEDPTTQVSSAEQTEVPAASQPYAAQAQAQQPYGQAAQSPYYAAAGYGQPMPPRGLSIASMVCGIVGVVLSFFFVGFLPALAGVILGHIGRKKEPAARGFSLTGLITGYVGLAFSLLAFLAILAAIFIPFLIFSTAPGAGYFS